MTARRFASFDPGSRRLGAVVGETRAEPWTLGDVGRLDVIGAQPFEVDAHDLAAAAGAAVEWAAGFGVEGAIIERGALYMPAKVTPQAARAIAVNHATMSKLADIIEAVARELGWTVRTVARATWVHAVIPRKQGGITDAMILAALPNFLAAESMAWLNTKDLRDAAGALLWSLLPPHPRVRARRRGDPNAPKRPPPVPIPLAWRTPEGRREWARMLDVKRSALRAHAYVPTEGEEGADARVEAGKVAGLAAAARLLLPCPCGPHRGGRRPSWCPHAPPLYAPYVCGLCGEARVGHVRGLPCPSLAPIAPRARRASPSAWSALAARWDWQKYRLGY